MVAEGASIHCSIDGPSDIHNRNRPFKDGTGSYDATVRHIRNALRISPDDSARVTVCPEHANSLDRIAEGILGHGFKHIGLFPANNMNWDEQDVSGWAESIAEVWRKYRNPDGTRMVGTLLDQRRQGHKTKRFDYCGAGKALWALDVTGNLFFCHHLTNRPEFAVIDAASNTTRDIRTAIERSAQPPKCGTMSEHCRACTAKDFCYGGCWANNLLTNGEATTPEQSECRLKVATVRTLGDALIIKSNVAATCKIQPRSCIIRDSGCTCQRCETCQKCDECQRCDDCLRCDEVRT
jgi:uncharacterized protein